jgi:hypothetical protein
VLDPLLRKEQELLLQGSARVEVPASNPSWLATLGGEEGPCELGGEEGCRI